MINIREFREKRGVSQRQLAASAKVSFRTIQLLESGDHDAKLSTLTTVLHSLGYVIDVNALPHPSTATMTEGKEWMIPFFEWVDTFRSHKDRRYITTPPHHALSDRMKALLASTTEALCHELALVSPSWCITIPPLTEPWFVSGMENLKASALIESPVWFRSRNIFVLENFLSRR